jgi:hypothetical protein
MGGWQGHGHAQGRWLRRLSSPSQGPRRFGDCARLLLYALVLTTPHSPAPLSQSPSASGRQAGPHGNDTDTEELRHLFSLSMAAETQSLPAGRAHGSIPGGGTHQQPPAQRDRPPASGKDQTAPAPRHVPPASLPTNVTPPAATYSRAGSNDTVWMFSYGANLNPLTLARRDVRVMRCALDATSQPTAYRTFARRSHSIWRHQLCATSSSKAVPVLSRHAPGPTSLAHLAALPRAPPDTHPPLPPAAATPPTWQTQACGWCSSTRVDTPRWSALRLARAGQRQTGRCAWSRGRLRRRGRCLPAQRLRRLAAQGSGLICYVRLFGPHGYAAAVLA